MLSSIDRHMWYVRTVQTIPVNAVCSKSATLYSACCNLLKTVIIKTAVSVVV